MPIYVQTSDEYEVYISDRIAARIEHFKRILEDQSDACQFSRNRPYPIPVSARILAAMIEYYGELLSCECEGFVLRNGPKQNWSVTVKVRSFFDDYQDIVCPIIQAASTLGANDILDAACLYLRDQIDTLTIDEIIKGY